MHREHRIDQDGLEEELVRFDWLSIVLHLRQHLQRLVATLPCCLVEARCEECVQDSNTVNAMLTKVCLCYLEVLIAECIYFKGALS